MHKHATAWTDKSKQYRCMDLSLYTWKQHTHTHTLSCFYFSARTINWSTLDLGPIRLNALWTSPKVAHSSELSPKARSHTRPVPHRSQCCLQYLTSSQTGTTEQNLIQDPGLWNMYRRALQVSWSKKSNSTLKKRNDLSFVKRYIKAWSFEHTVHWHGFQLSRHFGTKTDVCTWRRSAFFPSNVHSEDLLNTRCLYGTAKQS